MSRGRRRNDDWGGWPRYVPVAERKEKARKQAEKLRKKGDSLSPVVIAGRTIAATFWGKAWCQNLERYGDYENRIPRGRAYVRNGSVLDLKIGTARVDALVSGSHLYSVTIEIRPLKAQVWKGAKKACTGRIGSLLELLQGKLSREVMEIVTRPRTGLFPEPAEISFRCSCPDWASMCKHVAAVLYGIGARLDREPELLFRLRDVDHRELIAAPTAADLAASPGMGDKMIAEEDLAGIFGIEIDSGPTDRRTAPARPGTPKRGRVEAIRAAFDGASLLKGARSPARKTQVEVTEPPRHRRGRPSKTAVSAMAPKPPKQKKGRLRRLSESEVASAPRRGRPSKIRKDASLTPGIRHPVIAVEKPLPSLRRAYRPMPELRPDTTEPQKSRRGRPPKAAAPTAPPELQKAAVEVETWMPQKPRRGRPPKVSASKAADQPLKRKPGQP